MRKFFKRLLEKPWAAYTMATCSAVILYLILSQGGALFHWVGSIFGLLSPLVVGIIVAYIINPLVMFLEKRVFRKIKKEKVRYLLSAIIGILLTVLIIIAFFWLLVPSLVESFSNLLANSKSYMDTVNRFLEDLAARLEASNLRINIGDVTELVDDILNRIVQNLSQYLTTILNTGIDVGSAIFNVVIGFIIGVYLVLGKREMLDGIKTLRRTALTERQMTGHDRFWSRCNDIFVQYIGTNLLDALIIGSANAILMLIFRMPYVPLISFTVALTNLIPTFGPLIGGAIGVFILVLNKPLYALIFLIFTIILQTIDGYIIKPRLFSSSFGIPAVWTLIAIVVGGKLFSIAGMLLAIPVLAVLRIEYRETFLPWLKKRREQKEEEEREAAEAERVRSEAEEKVKADMEAAQAEAERTREKWEGDSVGE